MSVSFIKPSNMTWITFHKFRANEEQQKCDWNWATGTFHLQKQGGNYNFCLIQVKYFTLLLPYSSLMYLCIRTTLFSHLSNGTCRRLCWRRPKMYTHRTMNFSCIIYGSKLFAKNSSPASVKAHKPDVPSRNSSPHRTQHACKLCEHNAIW